MRDFVACLLGIREIVTTQKTVIAAKANQPGERKISIERANLHPKFISFCRNESFLMYFWERRNEIRHSDEKSAGCRIFVKKEQECGIRTPFQTLSSLLLILSPSTFVNMPHVTVVAANFTVLIAASFFPRFQIPVTIYIPTPPQLFT